jgi:hypothetical protein
MDRYVVEFVAHHYLMGVDHFFILNDNLDNDEESANFKRNLHPFVDASIVTVILTHPNALKKFDESVV